MTRWKIIIHAFIDGFSRFVTGIRASNNNHSQTVYNLFLDLIDTHGIPSRVRGDHGIENLLVAAFMEGIRGTARGSYIWGRFVFLSTVCYISDALNQGVFIMFVLNVCGVM